MMDIMHKVKAAADKEKKAKDHRDGFDKSLLETLNTPFQKAKIDPNQVNDDRIMNGFFNIDDDDDREVEPAIQDDNYIFGQAGLSNKLALADTSLEASSTPVQVKVNKAPPTLESIAEKVMNSLEERGIDPEDNKAMVQKMIEEEMQGMDDLPTPAATMDSATMMATSDVPKAATPKKAEKKGAQKDALPGLFREAEAKQDTEKAQPEALPEPHADSSPAEDAAIEPVMPSTRSRPDKGSSGLKQLKPVQAPVDHVQVQPLKAIPAPAKISDEAAADASNSDQLDRIEDEQKDLIAKEMTKPTQEESTQHRLAKPAQTKAADDEPHGILVPAAATAPAQDRVQTHHASTSASSQAAIAAQKAVGTLQDMKADADDQVQRTKARLKDLSEKHADTESHIMEEARKEAAKTVARLNKQEQAQRDKDAAAQSQKKTHRLAMPELVGINGITEQMAFSLLTTKMLNSPKASQDTNSAVDEINREVSDYGF